MEHDFMWTAGYCLSNMRLYVEGALVLFEDDALPLTKLAHEHEEWNAAEALNTIGEELYRLQEYIRKLQEAHGMEVQRQTETSVK
ncbi:MAG: hypothetical protein PUD16_05890 [bacterium]|nr:hypothetical protein [bacterium]